MIRSVILAAIALGVAIGDASAQTLVRVQGVAYDSLHATPLSGAFVVIAGTSKSAISDSLGRFTFDSVAPGTYRFVMQHDLLEAIGMTGATTRATIADGHERVTVAVPSFSTLWSAACGSTIAPADSGLVFGRMQLKGGTQSIEGAVVRATWIDIGFDRTSGVTQQRWHHDARADAQGNYALCGLPLEMGIRIQGATDSAASPVFDLAPLTVNRVTRRDLQLGRLSDLDSTKRGDVVGVVTGENRDPVPDARVSVAGLPEVRTDAKGRFTLRGLPAGTNQVEVKALGMSSTTAAVDVLPDDAKLVEIQLAKVTVLDSVVVKGNKVREQMIADINSRVKAGGGYFRDSLAVQKKPDLIAVFRDMTSVNVVVTRDRHIQITLPPVNAAKDRCIPPLWIDGKKVSDPNGFPEHDMLLDLHPEDIAMIEVYPRMQSAPPQYVVRGYSLVECGVILVWTKRIVP
jgi:hypothetical protein